MDEAKRIAGLLKQTYNGEPWHGPSLKETLGGVDFEAAYSKAPGGAHAISVIVEHLSFWMEVVSERLDGKDVDPSPEEDWRAPVDMTKEGWKRTLERLDNAYLELMRRIEKLTPEQLETAVVGKKYDNYTMLHGVISHNVYHSGQIAVLRKSFTKKK